MLLGAVCYRIAAEAAKIKKQNEDLEAENAEFKSALQRSPFDISPCFTCGKDVVCVPDGMPMCEPCGEKEERGRG